jgi:GNAT superfamily N-acetyltransferase
LEGLGSPRLLTLEDDISSFDCGNSALNDWLMRRAIANQKLGASKTYVATQGPTVMAYYSLSAGSLEHLNAPGKIRRNMPDPLPVILMGRLAVERCAQGQGVGAAMVLDALKRVQLYAEAIGIRGMLVNAKDESAAKFYQRLGFLPSPINPLLLVASCG